MINVIRAASRLGEFNVSDAEESIHYATRRGLVGIPEGDQVLGDVREAARKRMDKAVERGKVTKAKARFKTRGHRPKPKPKAKHKPRPKPAKKRKKR